MLEPILGCEPGDTTDAGSTSSSGGGNDGGTSPGTTSGPGATNGGNGADAAGGNGANGSDPNSSDPNGSDPNGSGPNGSDPNSNDDDNNAGNLAPGDAGADSGVGVNAATSWEVRGGSCTMQPDVAGGSVVQFSLLLTALLLASARRRRRWNLPTAALFIASAPATTRAQGTGDDYTAPSAPEDLLWVERAAPEPGALRPFARVSFVYADDPVVAESATGQQIKLIDSQLAIHTSLGAVISDRTVVALRLPVYLQETNSATVNGDAIAPQETSVGSLGLELRHALLDRSSPVELAVAATASTPIGDRSALVVKQSSGLWPRVIGTLRLGKRSFATAGVGPAITGASRTANIETGSELKMLAGVHLALGQLFGALIETSTSTLFSDPFERRATPVEGGAGLRLDAPPFASQIGLSSGLGQGIGSPDIRGIASLSITPAPPRPASPAKAVAPAVQCPPEDTDGFEDDDGCLDPDNDNDSVLDGKDVCPNKAEDFDAFEDQDGCPDLDNDKDGIDDGNDRCPLEAEDFDAFEDQDGCPDLDNDGDGLRDDIDRCPGDAETKNGIEDEDGCPDFLRVEAGQLRTLEPIYFEYARAEIQGRSEPLLLEMANTIRSRSDLGTIAIEGYTDSRGGAQYNLKLSQARADAVRDFLIDSGVPQERLTATGYGMDRPIADNATAAGRTKNRRVEFHFSGPSAAAGSATGEEGKP